MSAGQSDAGQRFQLLLHPARTRGGEREIQRERPAKQNGVDFVEGVATAIAPMALNKTIMVKG
jgi:hypothetical protein